MPHLPSATPPVPPGSLSAVFDRLALVRLRELYVKATSRKDRPALAGVLEELRPLVVAVSISNSYTQASRRLIAEFFRSRAGNDGLAGLVKPRRPFRLGLTHARDLAPAACCPDLAALTDPIADLASDGKGIPVLLRQYVRVGDR